MSASRENPELFENRKADHIRLALDERMQASGGTGIERIQLIHEAFPELDFKEVRLETEVFGRACASPLFISSMTAGHTGSIDLNLTMARVAERRRWPMGVGSQRRQLTEPEADLEWRKIRKHCPRVRLWGNIGLAQLIQSKPDEIRRLTDSLEAEAMIVHANPLQECLQPEGTPDFRGGLQAIERLIKSSQGLPVIVKETGCGFSRKTLTRLRGMGLAAVDVSGYGGTHWGRIEGHRSKSGENLRRAAETFRDWGLPTVESVMNALSIEADFAVWASGGVRSGLDAAKLVALGASMVGLAKPMIEAAVLGEEALNDKMAIFEQEMKIAFFCVGARSVDGMHGNRGVWQWAKI